MSAPGCARVLARLAVLADGGLAPLDEARDRGHLEACAGCARALVEHERRLGAVRAALRGDARAAEADLARVAAALRAPGGLALPRAAAARPPRRLALAAAAACVLALAGWLASTGRGAVPPAPRLASLVRPDVLVAPLPDWSDVLDGLARLARRLA